MFTWLSSLFMNPWMLAWLPMAAAPIIIHLWNRRRYREYHWAAMEYLLAAIKKSSRRMRIEQLLLLLVRTALLLLLVTAIAQPVLNAMGLTFAGGPRTHRVIVIDGSYSMDHRPQQESLFQIAKQKAIEVVQASNEGDGFSLVVMSESARPIVSTVAFDDDDVTEEIRSLRLPHGGANLLPVVQAVNEIVRSGRQDNPRLAQSHVYFFTDLGQNTWDEASLSTEEQAMLREGLQRLAAEGTTEVVPLGQPGVSNTAVTGLRIIDTYATVQRPVAIEAAVGNWGGQSTERSVVELLIDGVRVDQQTIDVQPGEPAVPVRFQYHFTTPGEHEVEVRIAGDSLDTDNHRYLSVPVKEYIRALCVSGKQDSTLYVALGLDPDHADGSESIIQPHVVSESGLLDSDLSSYDCIFLCNVAQFTAREAAVLQAQLDRGAGLVFFLGDQVRADRYNRELCKAAGAAHDVLPVKIEEAIEARTDEGGDGFVRFDPLGYEHPIMQVWQDNEQAGFLRPMVAKYWQLTIPPSLKEDAKSETRVALGFENGDPAIVEGRVGNGRVLVVATAGSTTSVTRRDNEIRPWTFLSTGPNFPVLVQQLWQAAVAGRLAERNVHVFEAIGGELREPLPDERIQLNLPASGTADDVSSRSITVPPTVDAMSWTFAETDQSGIYQATIESLRQRQTFAVNVNTRESDLARISAEEIPSGLTTRVMKTEDVDSTMEVEAPPSPMHQSILWLVMALVFTESTLAWWLGNRQI